MEKERIDRRAVAPERIWKWRGGGTDPAQSAEQTFSVVSLHLLGSKSRPTISCFGERFHDGQYSLVSFLFAVLLLTVPTVPSHL